MMAPDLSSSALFGQPAQSFISGGLLQCKGFHQSNLYQTAGKNNEQNDQRYVKRNVMELVQDQEPTTIQFLILEENQVLPLKWYKPKYGSGHSWLIQAEGTSHCSGGQQAKSAICTTILRVGVAALRNYHTRLSKQSNVLAFCRTISLSINVQITQLYRWETTFTSKKQTLF